MGEEMIRRATLDDVAALQQIGRQTIVETFLEDFAIPYPVEDWAVFLDRSYGTAAIRAKLSDPLGAAWLAERDGEVVGYATTGPCKLPHPEARADDPELQQIYVRRDAQGSGVGRALLDVALAHLEQAGRPIWLGVWSGNERAQRVYLQRGFRKVGDYHFPVGTWFDDEFIFRRDVA